MPDASPMLALTTTQDLRTSSLSMATFLETATGEGLRHVRHATFPVGRVTLEQLTALGDAQVAERLTTGAAALLRVEPRTVVALSAIRGNGEISVAGADRGEVDRVTANLVAALREPERDGERDDVPVTFWASASGPPMAPRRRVPAPAWTEIARNYAPATRDALETLMAATEPGPGGLLLWHGDPGTGKSHALRALVRAWQPWCDAHFIADPETFLGAHAGYLLNALLRASLQRARLLILEDAGELLAADARAVAGQALSRLLNLSDGLLGAGLRLVVLITTNEPLRRLHPAVVRPGRCWAQVEFGPLPAPQADAWLQARRPDASIGRTATIAELFAVASGRRPPTRQSLGFVSG